MGVDAPVVVHFCVDFLRFLLGLADVTILKVPEQIRWVFRWYVGYTALQQYLTWWVKKGSLPWKHLRSILCNSLKVFQLAIWGQNHRLVQVEESEDEVCRALSCGRGDLMRSASAKERPWFERSLGDIWRWFAGIISIRFNSIYHITGKMWYNISG